MLPPAHRLTDSSLFRQVVRNGRRCGRATLVVHLMCPDPVSPEQTEETSDGIVFEAPTKVGFVVSKAVGNAVIRNRVQRRLRHAARAELLCSGQSSVLPEHGCTLVVRALPAAATASFDDLAADLHAGLQRARARGNARPSRAGGGS